MTACLHMTAEGAATATKEARPLRVAFISHTAILGGAEKALVELVEGFCQAGVDCLVFLPSEGPIRPALERVGARCAVVKYSWWSNPVHRFRRNLVNLAAIPSLMRAFRREKVDLVYSNTSMAPSGAAAAKLCGVPHVWHVREFGKEDHDLEIDIGEKLGFRLIGRLSAKVVCVSKAVEAKYRTYIPGDKLATIYDKVAVAPRSGEATTSSSGVVCVLVGVVRPSKGQTEAVEAIDLLAREGIDVSLVLVGSGPGEAEVRALIEAKGLGGRVHMTGYLEDPSAVVERADIVLMCSRCEAFSRAPLEGMMAGKPVVGSRSGGTVEAVTDHFNGLLYAPGDARDLADKIRRLAMDPGYARRLGENARAWATANFTHERFMKEMLAIVRDAARVPG